MKINTKEIFERMDLQHIINFILYGYQISEPYNITYEQRLSEGYFSMLQRLKSLYKEDETELENSTDEFNTALIINSQVFTEIGMKAGAQLIFQLLRQDD